jgi:hypothetical protein
MTANVSVAAVNLELETNVTPDLLPMEELPAADSGTWQRTSPRFEHAKFYPILLHIPVTKNRHGLLQSTAVQDMELAPTFPYVLPTTRYLFTNP